MPFNTSNVAYSVEELTAGEAEAIRMLKGHYAWADVLAPCITEDDDGNLSLELSEHEAWEFNQAADDDDLTFPGAADELRGKLSALWGRVV